MANVLKNLGNMLKNSGGPGKGAVGFAGILTVGGLGTYTAYESLFNVEGGHRVVMFNRLTGVDPMVVGEGTHFRLPWFQVPYDFNIRTRPKNFRSPTGTRDLQMVDLTLRVLFKPSPPHLPEILSRFGENYDQRVMNSIVNETLKGVIAQFNANQLITQREKISNLIKRNLKERAKDFHIIVDDVSITHLTFGKEYSSAVEAKQVAQQEAERAKFQVKQAEQEKRSTIIKAQGEAKSAEMIGQAVSKNPGYITLRQLDAALAISATIAKSNNKVYLNSDSLCLDVLQESGSVKRLEKK